MGYSVLMGITLSSWLYLFQLTSVILIFLLTGLYFGALAAYGHFTNRSLAGYKSILLSGLIFLILFGVLSLFIPGMTAFDSMISLFGIAISLGYTAYDTQRIREFSNAPIILLTAKSENEDKVLGLNVGADDYITKPFGMMEFIARVKAVLRRSSRHGDDRELSCEELRIFPGRHQVYCDDQPVELTRKEFELLLYLMENRGIVMTRDQILCHIWGYDFDGETRTVDVHVRTLRQKLGDTGRLIETVRGVGYRMADKGGSQG